MNVKTHLLKRIRAEDNRQPAGDGENLRREDKAGD